MDAAAGAPIGTRCRRSPPLHVAAAAGMPEVRGSGHRRRRSWRSVLLTELGDGDGDDDGKPRGDGEAGSKQRRGGEGGEEARARGARAGRRCRCGWSWAGGAAAGAGTCAAATATAAAACRPRQARRARREEGGREGGERRARATAEGQRATGRSRWRRARQPRPVHSCLHLRCSVQAAMGAASPRGGDERQAGRGGARRLRRRVPPCARGGGGRPLRPCIHRIDGLGKGRLICTGA